MVKLISLTAAAIFTAEALVMLFLESMGGQLSLPGRILLDSSLLMVCVVPTLYFLIFKEMAEQIRLRNLAEQAKDAWNQSLEKVVEERTERLQRSNEDLLIEVQERAKAAMALRKALNEAQKGKKQLHALMNAIREALVVVDENWCVLVANQRAEVMFGTNSYDLLGHSLKEFLRPWSRKPTDLDEFFRHDQGESLFLTPPESHGCVSQPVQMCIGADLEWEGRAAMVLIFYHRQDLAIPVIKAALPD